MTSSQKSARTAEDDRPRVADAYDVVVVGSGAGGLSAAVTAAFHGLSVLVVERADRVGGATARSGGWMWAPGNPMARAARVAEPREDFRSYLRSVLGERYDAERLEVFLETVPHMVGFFEGRTRCTFVPGATINDIYGENPGAGTGNRSVGPKPLYATALRKAVRAVMPHQFYMTSFVGMGIMAGPDLQQFLTALHKPGSFLHAARRTAIHGFDLVVHHRNMQMVNGLALVARLLWSADELGVAVATSTNVIGLEQAGGRVCGVQLLGPDGRSRSIAARRGVVLATGGYPANRGLRAKTFERTPTGDEHWTLAPATCDGAGLALAESVGGRLDASGRSAAAWCPVSLVELPGGRQGVFPHIADRAKPGVIGVLRDGRRFVNEANGYYDYVDGMMKAVPDGQPVESWLICDHRVLRNYMLGFAKPRPLPVWPYRAIGYLKKGRTLRELAQRCGIDATGLEETVAHFNENARRGIDPDFHRGETPFNRYGGDPLVTPNPSLAPIVRAPFYAVKVLPGSFGTFAGIAVDPLGRVTREDGSCVPGLHVAGNDMASVMGGSYPAGGVNLGPAMTFGYLAGRLLAGATAYEDDGTQAPGPDYLGRALATQEAIG